MVMGRMIEVEGFKAFRGSMRIYKVFGDEMVIYGDWLFRPDTDCWYCSGDSYPADVCEVVYVFSL